MKKMRLVRAMIALILSALLAGLITGMATANVPGVAINAPPPPPAPNVATAGSEQTIKVVVTHRDTGSPPLHYVDRVMLYDGNKLLKEWKYDQNNYNKNEVWTESTTVPVRSDMHLRAVAHCTVHGFELTGVHVRVLSQGTKPSDMMQTDAMYAGMQAFGYSDAKKASDFVSSADSQFLQGIIKTQSGDLKSFQGKLSDWMKSSEGEQFISQQAPLATKPAGASMMPAKVLRKVTVVDVSGNIPRVSAIVTPTPLPRGKGGIASPKASPKASPAVKYLQAMPVASKPIASPGPMASPSARPIVRR